MPEVSKVLHSQSHSILICIFMVFLLIFTLYLFSLPNKSEAEFGDPFEENLLEASGYVIDAFGGEPDDPDDPDDGKDKLKNKPKAATRFSARSKPNIDSKPKAQAKVTKVPKGPPPERGTNEWFQEFAKNSKNAAERGARLAANNKVKLALKQRYGRK